MTRLCRACPELFHDKPNWQARTICHRCPRIHRCAIEALEVPGTEGMWAGVWLASPSDWREKERRDAALTRLERIAAGARIDAHIEKDDQTAAA